MMRLTKPKKERQLLNEKGEYVLAIIPLNLDSYLLEWQDRRTATLRKRVAADIRGAVRADLVGAARD